MKINAVIERGLNDHTALDLLERFRGSPVIVRFIEFMDVGNRNKWRPELVVPSRELAARIQERWPMRPISQNYPGEVAQRWQFDDGGGEVGFISSVSQPFCGACSRARLSSEGKFYTCLFATHGLDLRAPLRAGAERRGPPGADRTRRLARPHRSLAANCARNSAAERPNAEKRKKNRDVLHRRLIAMTFTHLDANLHPAMVDVGEKKVTKRTATAEARVRFPSAVATALRDSGLRSPKGPVFDTAIVAGVNGARRTHP